MGLPERAISIDLPAPPQLADKSARGVLTAVRTKRARLSMRMLEARAHSAKAACAWDQITKGWQDMAEEADECRREGRLWHDPDFPHNASSIEQQVHDLLDDSSQPQPHSDSPRGAPVAPSRERIMWLPLRTIMGAPHVWPDGRLSYLFPYGKNAAEVLNAAIPADTAQGSLGDCYFLSAVAATIGDPSIRSDLIDESLEEVRRRGQPAFAALLRPRHLASQRALTLSWRPGG